MDPATANHLFIFFLGAVRGKEERRGEERKREERRGEKGAVPNCQHLLEASNRQGVLWDLFNHLGAAVAM